MVQNAIVCAALGIGGALLGAASGTELAAAGMSPRAASTLAR
jgi:hypothetical protein